MAVVTPPTLLRHPLAGMTKKDNLMRKFNKRTLAVATGVGMLAAGGVAWAAFTSTATGNGTLHSTTSVSSSVSTTGASGLYPGGHTDFTVTITNNNSYPVKVTTIRAGGSDVATGTNGTCAAGLVTTDAVTNPAPTTLAASGGRADYPMIARMSPDATNFCQGKDFNVVLTADLDSVPSS